MGRLTIPFGEVDSRASPSLIGTGPFGLSFWEASVTCFKVASVDPLTLLFGHKLTLM
jgi:hypothetical protein